MFVVVVGARLGRRLVEELISRKINVAVVDSNGKALESLAQKTSQISIVQGKERKPEILYKAGAERADALVALTDKDEDNVSIAVIAKNHFRVPRILALMNDPVHEWLFSKDLGVDIVLVPSNLIADAALTSIQTTNLRT
jgi:trk system potassium uptake protein TrkA